MLKPSLYRCDNTIFLASNKKTALEHAKNSGIQHDKISKLGADSVVLIKSNAHNADDLLKICMLNKCIRIDYKKPYSVIIDDRLMV